jgi:hypothetical protein
MIEMQSALTDRVRQGLLTALGSGSIAVQGTKPTNSEAYDLFLRAAAVSNDPDPNRQAIALLEKAVALDPDYEPAWSALALRYYYDAEYGGAGEAMFLKAERAIDKARELDPDDVRVLTQSITMRTERADLQDAYRDALDLLRKRPDDGNAHFAMAYLLRYAGELQESAGECERAIALDPNNAGFRSCVYDYEMLGNFERARQLEYLEPNSAWMAGQDAHMAMRGNDMQRARADLDRMSPQRRAMLEPCLNHTLSQDHALVVEARNMRIHDPEPKYNVASILATCGHGDIALRLLKTAADHGYCAVTYAATDSLFASIRSKPEFAAILAQGRECRRRFAEFRASIDQRQ